jgi:hypothetical protein
MIYNVHIDAHDTSASLRRWAVDFLAEVELGDSQELMAD